MLRIRLLAVGLSALGLALASEGQAQVQQYSASWVADSFGNDKVGGTGASQYFSVFAMPQGILCNNLWPRCTFDETPTDGKGNFNPLGGNKSGPAVDCQPLSLFGTGTTVRPAKGATGTTGGGALDPLAPRYRNPNFFTPGGAPNTVDCTATSTVGGSPATIALTTDDPLRGPVMKGAPLTGGGLASTTAKGAGKAFGFSAAPATPAGKGNDGFRRTTSGEFAAIFPYIYSYTYFTLRNSKGAFGPGEGFFTTAATPTALSIPYITGTGMAANTVANVKVKRGANTFGGVMRLLGQSDTKVCYFNKQGCNLGGANWLYDVIGTDLITPSGSYTSMGVVTKGYITSGTEKYYHTVLQTPSTFTVKGERFPWTTGTVTLTALGRGPHKTTEVRKGFDSRSVSGKGKVQLVSPLLTHWLVPNFEFETGGIAILKLEFLPEPSKWMMLVAGLSMLGVLYHYRGR